MLCEAGLQSTVVLGAKRKAFSLAHNHNGDVLMFSVLACSFPNQNKTEQVQLGLIGISSSQHSGTSGKVRKSPKSS